MRNLVIIQLIFLVVGIYLHFKFDNKDKELHNLGSWLFWISFIISIIVGLNMDND
jgi:uncharacterized membrane protein